MRKASSTDWGTLALVGFGVWAVNKVLGIFGHDNPGGDDVPPAEGDTRPATFSAVDARTLADGIGIAVWGDGLIVRPWEQDAVFAQLLQQCQVTRDAQLLANAYGYRGPILSKLNLWETIADYLDADYLAAVNADWQAKGITIHL